VQLKRREESCKLSETRVFHWRQVARSVSINHAAGSRWTFVRRRRWYSIFGRYDRDVSAAQWVWSWVVEQRNDVVTARRAHCTSVATRACQHCPLSAYIVRHTSHVLSASGLLRVIISARRSVIARWLHRRHSTASCRPTHALLGAFIVFSRLRTEMPSLCRTLESRHARSHRPRWHD